ncbi:MAG: DUF6798 domain-containing protein [Chloroflexota bacterium]
MGRSRLAVWFRGTGFHPAARLFAALAFALAYSQSPLFTSNQNQYFLHGAARAGLGFLTQDWLANTADSVPAFSLLVEWTYRVLHPSAFYLYQLALLALYLVVLDDLAHLALGPDPLPATRWAFLAFFIGLHSAGLRFLLGRGLGPDWEYLFDGGLAGQRLLGPVFQPSVFGVLLLLAILLYLRGRVIWAAVSCAAAASLHPTYLLAAAVLTTAFMLDSWLRTRRLSPLLSIGITALMLVLPITLYLLLRLGPTGPDTIAEAQRILVDVRIPHHALVAEWLDATVLIKMTLIAAGLVLTRRSRLFPLLAFPTVVGLVLTLLQVWTRNLTLALLFPWRVSVVVVPIATALIAGRSARCVIGALEKARPRLVSWVPALSAAVIGVCVLAGLARFAVEVQQQRWDAAGPMLAFVERSKASGQVYLIPPDLQQFHLATGAPALVDFKSIPYRDVEVLEWYQRLRLAQWFYRDRVEDVDCGLLQTARLEYGVTDVLLDEDLLSLDCPGLREVYRDSAYVVAQIED